MSRFSFSLAERSMRVPRWTLVAGVGDTMEQEIEDVESYESEVEQLEEEIRTGLNAGVFAEQSMLGPGGGW